jgi:hypothetical protein
VIFFVYVIMDLYEMWCTWIFAWRERTNVAAGCNKYLVCSLIHNRITMWAWCVKCCVRVMSTVCSTQCYDAVTRTTKMAVGLTFELCCSNVGCKCGRRDWFNVYCFCPLQNTLRWLRWLVPGLSPQRSGFHPRSVQMRFVVNRVVL